ncbi:hypothetical protein D0T49_11720 [Paludibacter sp. 221]|uniref:tetratricopeptide repeat protein n=1 Tax=Paludibacter sp. 221 TaxID=2302939 RepID=UPI0013D31D88|nr:tetratricopeptide repeat protein [Paludibacter sp. 221]NDV47715.1 hypothetical protein [Paludibacter sp. 221]
MQWNLQKNVRTEFLETYFNRLKKVCFFFVLLLLLPACSSLKNSPKQRTISTDLTDDSTRKQFYYYYYEGLRLLDNKEYDQALETLLLCYSIDSLNAGLNSDLGMLYASIGFMDESIRHFEKAVELQPANWWHNLRLINLLSEQKKYDRAIELTSKLQKRYPYRENVYFTLASLYTQTKEYNKAIETYDKLEKITDINEYLAFEKFRLYVQAGKPKKGVAEIEKLIEKYPAEIRYKVLRGDIYMQQKMPEKALEIYESVLAEDPQNPQVYLSLSDYYNAMNEAEKALEFIVEALKNEQLDVETKMGILGNYIENLVADKKKIDETEELFKLLIEYYPLEEQVHIYYALFLEFQERRDDMLEELETILYINPQNEAVWMQIFQIYFAKEDFEKAVATGSNAIENLPDNPAMYFYKSIAQAQLKDYDGALETSLKALTLFEDNGSGKKKLMSDIYSQIGDIYYNKDEKQKAFGAYESALKVYPGNIYTMNNYAYYLSLEKENLRHAERLSAKTVEMEPRNSTFLDTYAWILFQQEQYSLAKLYIERAIDNLESEKESGVLYDHYGDILWKNGDEEKALEMWKKALDTGLESDTLKQKIETKQYIEEKKQAE